MAQASSGLAASVDVQFSVHQYRTRLSPINATISLPLLDIATFRIISPIHEYAKSICKTPVVRHYDRKLKKEERE